MQDRAGEGAEREDVYLEYPCCLREVVVAVVVVVICG